MLMPWIRLSLWTVMSRLLLSLLGMCPYAH